MDSARWMTHASICKWEGIARTANGCVTEINRVDRNLKGTIPENVTLLQHLTVLDLSDNELQGTVPPGLWLPPLVTLDLSGNQLTGRVSLKLCHKAGGTTRGSLNREGHEDEEMTSCNRIICDVGTYNKLGRATAYSPCHKCSRATYLGAKTCPAPVTVFGVASVGFFLLSIGVVIGCVITALRTRNDIESDEHSILDALPDMDDGVDENSTWQSSHKHIMYTGQTMKHDETEDLMRSNTLEDNTKRDDNKDIWLDVPEITDNTKKDGNKEVWLDVPKIT